MQNRSQSQIIFTTLIGFSLFFIFNKLFFKDLYEILLELINIKSISFLLAYIFVGIPIFLATYYIGEYKSFFKSLGLRSSILTGLGIGVVGTLPMLVGYGLSFDINSGLTTFKIFTGSICAGFFEELYFRGFLFGMLYRFTRLGFIPSLILCALIFGSVHLYQSDNIGSMIGIFFTTFMGAGLFAWLYAEWNFNLWVPISLHLFMNLFWMLFDVSGDALGGLNANVFRVATIVLVVTGTVIYKLKNDGIEVNKRTIWMKESIN